VFTRLTRVAITNQVESPELRRRRYGGLRSGKLVQAQAQPDKADALRDAGKKEAAAESARACPDAAEARDGPRPCSALGPLAKPFAVQCFEPPHRAITARTV